MNAFISTDCDTILERLQGEKLLNIVPDELGNVLLVFESSNPDTLLRITPALVDGTPIIKVETQSLNQQ